MISIKRITKTYESSAGRFSAVQSIDLEIRAGDFVAIVGKSGSGKSTLLNMMGGIDRPSSGSVVVGGITIQDLTENQLAAWRGRTVGFVFQFFQLLPTLTAAENVMLPMDFCRMLPARERRKRALDLLDRVGVARQADKLPSALSGGEQQRVAIARALANEPPVVIADEPTGNLDSVTAHAILDIFRSMASRGTTVVIATHERDIGGIIDRTVKIADGIIVPITTNSLSQPPQERAE
jgi:putative ABC transport system ATP-binding protein